MNKNQRIVALSAIGAIVFVILLFALKDMISNSSTIVHCKDGARTTINLNNFIVQYSQYSVQLEGSIGGAQIAGKLQPEKLQQLSESMQSTIEFRKALIEGFNHCAISMDQYRVFTIGFQNMDVVAHQIDELSKKATLTSRETGKLDSLVTHYVQLSRSIESIGAG